MNTPCHVCGGDLKPINGPTTDGLVTSDCRPWRGVLLIASCSVCGVVQKPQTNDWQSDAERIYAGYGVYAQGSGAEQKSYDSVSGEGQARSERIIRWLGEKTEIPSSGQLLDIGCGNGSFLRAFSKAHPDWKLTGAELDDRNRAQIEAISGVTRLHLGPLDELHETFDLIVMVHALEHIPDPAAFLRMLHAKLEPGGKVLIEVPDLNTSPFDVLIADHCTHFTPQAIEMVVRMAGYEATTLDAFCIPKEITLLAANAKQHKPPPREPPAVVPKLLCNTWNGSTSLPKRAWPQKSRSASLVAASQQRGSQVCSVRTRTSSWMKIPTGSVGVT